PGERAGQFALQLGATGPRKTDVGRPDTASQLHVLEELRRSSVRRGGRRTGRWRVTGVSMVLPECDPARSWTLGLRCSPSIRSVVRMAAFEAGQGERTGARGIRRLAVQWRDAGAIRLALDD